MAWLSDSSSYGLDIQAGQAPTMVLTDDDLDLDSLVGSEGGGAEAPEPEGQEELADDRPEAKKEGKGQYFVFTLNLGKSEEEALRRVELFRNGLDRMKIKREISFVSVGHEIAPRTGEHHLQGYIEVFGGKRITFATFKKFDCWRDQKSVWVAAARGSAHDNITYTGKAKDEGRYYEVWGEFRNYGQGKSKELIAVQKKLDAGVALPNIYKEHFTASARHFRFFDRYQSATRPARTEASQVHYIYGPSGTGKSRYCFEKWGADDTKVFWLPLQKSGNNVWWDGYEGQETVIIDDFYPGYFGSGHVTFMLRLVDRYPFQVPIHGGQVRFTSKTIVFTSNTPIDSIDDEKFSGYPWDNTNPLFNRVYLRDPKWVIVPMLQPAQPAAPVPPAPRLVRVTALRQADQANVVLDEGVNPILAIWEDAKRRRINSSF